MLALVFLVVIGLSLIAESLHLHVEKGYIYAALGFSVLVELLNMAYRSQSHRRN
jgi:predicted tellurium resistance membrane protein TerC